MGMNTIVYFGNSHLLALRRRCLEVDPASAYGVQAKFFLALQGFYERPWRIEDNRFVWDEALTRDMSAAITGDEVPFIVTSLFNNMWSIRATFDNAVPYDFFLEDCEAPADDLPREIIPLSLMRSLARLELDSIRMWFEFVRSLTDKPIYELIGPPPVDLGANRYGPTRHFGDGASEQIEKFGIMPPLLRKKHWLLFMRETTKLCGELGVATLTPPANTMDSEGNLLVSMESGDSLHANPLYGHRVLESVANIAHTFQQSRSG